jgi:hypothetical protein
MFTNYTNEEGLQQTTPIQNTIISTKKSITKPVKLTKTKRVLLALMNRSYNRFEASRQLSDWCLHSTVATIQSKGIIVNRRFETVPGYEGIPTSVCRYWIDKDQHERAEKFLRLR